MDRSQLQRDGFVVAEGLIPPHKATQWLKQVRAAVHSVGAWDDPSGVHVWKVASLPDAIRAMALDPRLVGLARDAIDEPIEFLSLKPVFKRPDVSFASPWHQDAAYCGGYQMVVVCGDNRSDRSKRLPTRGAGQPSWRPAVARLHRRPSRVRQPHQLGSAASGHSSRRRTARAWLHGLLPRLPAP